MNRTAAMPDLFSRAPTRHADPQTSRDAAASVDPSKDEAMIIELLTRYGPKTTKEAAAISGRRRENISPRFAPLERRGVIEKTEDRRDGCTVWRLR